jgi:hypothetical protein
MIDFWPVAAQADHLHAVLQTRLQGSGKALKNRPEPYWSNCPK